MGCRGITAAMSTGEPGPRAAVDIGGTFTDLVAVGSGRELVFGKAPTTPAALEEGVMRTLAHAGVGTSSLSLFVHGTTVVVNSITERRGARTALITNPRIPRRARDRPGQPTGPVQPVVPEACASGPPAAPVRGYRADVLPRRGSRASGRGGDRSPDQRGLGALQGHLDCSWPSRATCFINILRPDRTPWRISPWQGKCISMSRLVRREIRIDSNCLA